MAAASVASGETKVYSLDEKRSYRQRAAERRGRWAETFLPAHEHKLPAEVCRQLLDAIPERARDGKIHGYLYATTEEREMAAGRLPLRRATPPPRVSPAPRAEPEPLPPSPIPPAEPEAARVWLGIVEQLVLPATHRALWLDPLVAVGLDDQALTLWAPSRFVSDWVQREHGKKIQAILDADDTGRERFASEPRERFALLEPEEGPWPPRTIRWVAPETLPEDTPAEAMA